MKQRLVVVTAIALAVGACTRPQHTGMVHASPDASAYGAEVVAGYARVRAATSRFHVVDSAIAAGYAANVPQCISDSVHGAMGYHHINRALVDNKVDVEHPEFVLYERRADGSYVMNAVEYIVPYRVWPRDSVPPKLLGRDMLQNDALNLWNLHMWVWTKNPAGLFAEYNPAVKCPPLEPDYPSPELAATKAPYERVMTAADGRIWIQVSALSEPYGTYAVRVPVARDTYPVFIRGDTLWIVSRDDDGSSFLTKTRIEWR